MLVRGGREVGEDGREEGVELKELEGRRKPILLARGEKPVGRDEFRSWEPRGVGSGRACSGLRWRSTRREEEGVGGRRKRRREGTSRALGSEPADVAAGRRADPHTTAADRLSILAPAGVVAAAEEEDEEERRRRSRTSEGGERDPREGTLDLLLLLESGNLPK